MNFRLAVVAAKAGTTAGKSTPRRYGHSIENVGDKPARILIGFNSGIYASIDLTQWIAGNPADVLATNFGQTAELVQKFPHRDVFVAGSKGPGKK
jgi:oxalate decarboxylase